MKRYSVEIARTAKDDLLDIFRHIRDVFRVPDTAKEQIQRIRIAVLSLGTQPERYALLPDEHFAGMGIRRLPVDNYLIFYQADHKKSVVYVLRVLHGRRNWAAILGLSVSAIGE